MEVGGCPHRSTKSTTLMDANVLSTQKHKILDIPAEAFMAPARGHNTLTNALQETTYSCVFMPSNNNQAL